MTEEELVKSRFKDLANRSYINNIYVYTDFLNTLEMDMFFQVENELKFVPHEIQMNMIRFGNEETTGYDEKFPFVIIKTQPINKKFADELSHRDILGALMNLGIERNCIGEIKLDNNNAYIYVVNRISNYILDNLNKIKHTQIKTSILEELPKEIKPNLKEERFTVTSLRLDLIIAKAYNISRSQSLELFRTKKIYVNSRNSENNSLIINDGDIISVRGFGKFIFVKSLGVNKKRKTMIIIEKYI